MQNGTGTRATGWHKSDTTCSSVVPVGSADVLQPKNENPGALAGATGADVHGTFTDHHNSSDRDSAAMAYVAFGRAIADLPAHGRMIALEHAFERLRAGEPIPAFICVMSEARDWAAWASRAERKAYALACFERLNDADRAAFLSHIGARAAT